MGPFLAANDWDLAKLRGIANYQFGKGLGEVLFPRRIEVVRSRRTRRIRHVYLNGKLIATLRPSDGLLALTIHGAKMVASKSSRVPRVVVRSDIGPFVEVGRNVFAKHVVDAVESIRPQDEVIVSDASGKLVAVGRAAMSGGEMLSFKSGVAVRVRKGVKE